MIDQVLVSDLFVLADRHHADLGIENGGGGAPGHVDDDLDVLPAGMKDLQHLVVAGQQVEQGIEIDAVGQRIDRGRFLAVRNLHQAQQGPVRRFAHELGVHGDEIGLFQTFAQGGELAAIADQGMDFHAPIGLRQPAPVYKPQAGFFTSRFKMFVNTDGAPTGSSLSSKSALARSRARKAAPVR